MLTKSLVLHSHTGATLAMFGVIWLVQVCHYPGLLIVGDSPQLFAHYHEAHIRRISYVVMPFMLVELGTALLLVGSTTGLSRSLALSGLALVGVLWLSTMFLQVPLHNQLATGFDRQVCERLVSSNWIRTLAWTLRAGLALTLYSLTDMGKTLQLPGLTGF